MKFSLSLILLSVSILGSIIYFVYKKNHNNNSDNQQVSLQRGLQGMEGPNPTHKCQCDKCNCTVCNNCSCCQGCSNPRSDLQSHYNIARKGIRKSWEFINNNNLSRSERFAIQTFPTHPIQSKIYHMIRGTSKDQTVFPKRVPKTSERNL